MFLTSSSSWYYTNSISLLLLGGLGQKRKTLIQRLRTIDWKKQESIWGKALIRQIIAIEGQESGDQKEVFLPFRLFDRGLSPWQVKQIRFSPNQRGFHVPSTHRFFFFYHVHIFKADEFANKPKAKVEERAREQYSQREKQRPRSQSTQESHRSSDAVTARALLPRPLLTPSFFSFVLTFDFACQAWPDSLLQGS